MDTLGEREAIQRLIFKLRQRINLQLAFGDADEANRLRDEIGGLERQLQLNEREQKAREERG